MFKFLIKKAFLINTAIAIVVIIIAIWGTFKFIASYTHHGESISVPSLEGLTLTEVETTLTEKKLRFSILDSIFKIKAERGVVLDQNPIADALVKENRTIYITVSKVIPPKITMPDVIESSQRLAIGKLKSYGLKIKKIEYIPSTDPGYVLSHKIKDVEIKTGDKIDEGSAITLVIGAGKGDHQVMVPYLINLNRTEAIEKLQLSSLEIGAEIHDGSCDNPEDSLSAKIYRQNPIRSKNVALYIGSSVDLYFTCDSSIIDYDSSLDSLTRDTGIVE
jgi:eukaryotic-like serine/threonine-protein kinase